MTQAQIDAAGKEIAESMRRDGVSENETEARYYAQDFYLGAQPRVIEAIVQATCRALGVPMQQRNKRDAGRYGG